MWYLKFKKISLRKHNLRVDLRVYPGDELEMPEEQELASKLKSLLSSSIIKGLDIIGITSRFGVQIGLFAKQLAEQNRIDIKVIPGQDYTTADKYKAVFYNIQQDIALGKMYMDAAKEVKAQGGKILLYDLSKSHARALNQIKETQLAPDFVEIYNAHSSVFKDLNIDFFEVISSAARSGSDLESIPVYTEIPRKKLVDIGLLQEEEGESYVPGYLR